MELSINRNFFMRCHLYFVSLYTHVALALRGAYYDSKYKYNDFYKEANHNFSKVVRVVDEHGTVVILKRMYKNTL